MSWECNDCGARFDDDDNLRTCEDCGKFLCGHCLYGRTCEYCFSIADTREVLHGEDTDDEV